MLFSILIPAYNAEKYILKCVNSIKNQSFEDWECIIVDDGSDDATYDLISKNICNDNRFLLIKRENMGVAKTRNLLINNANGDFVFWVDSDDFIAPNTLKILYENIMHYNADIYVFNYTVVENNCKNFEKKLIESDVKITSKEALKYLAEEYKMPSFLCNKIFRRKIFKDVTFREDLKMLEDYDIMPRLFYKANEIVLIKDSLYYYRQVNNSITHNISKDMIKRSIEIMKMRAEFIQNCHPELVRYINAGRAFASINNIILCKENNYNNLYKYFIKDLRKNLIYFLLNKRVKLKSKIGAVALAINFQFYQILRRL